MARRTPAHAQLIQPESSLIIKGRVKLLEVDMVSDSCHSAFLMELIKISFLLIVLIIFYQSGVKNKENNLQRKVAIIHFKIPRTNVHVRPCCTSIGQFENETLLFPLL